MKWQYDAVNEIWTLHTRVGSIEVMDDPDEPGVYWYLLVTGIEVQSDSFYLTLEEAQAAALVEMRARLQAALAELTPAGETGASHD
jgi:hypothetical protein